MRKIGVVNFKGGSGKTTTVINIGAGLAARGKRVLLVDVDAQGSLAVSLGLPYTKSLADVLAGQATIEEATVRARPNLFVIPSDNSLLFAQKTIARYVNWRDVLGRVLQAIEESYDFILIDCAASLSLLNANALSYATEIFIPTQVEYLSLVGLNQVLENLARIRFPDQPRHSVTDLGISLIIPTMYDVRKRQSRRLLAQLRETYGHHVATPIRINVRLSEAPYHHKTIFEYAPRSRGAFDYNRLVDVILQETLLIGEEPISLQRPFTPTREEVPVVSGEVPSNPPAQADAEAEARPAAATPSEPSPMFEPTPAPAPLSLDCPYCNIPLTSLTVAGYRVYQCERCGYQKQILIRDLRV